jgi:ATP-dependent DNA helicase RecG
LIPITDILSQGENSAVEFKSAGTNAEMIAREMISFANTNGGVILVGVEDDGTISGVDTDKQNETWASNIARDAVVPPLNVHSQTVDFQGKHLLYIDVPKGKHKPYHSNSGKFYIRIGSTNRAPSQVELMRLFQQSGSFHYDQVGIEKTTVNDLNLYKIDSYFEQYGLKFNEEEDKERLLRNVDLLTEEGNVTVAGLLVFGINPQRYLLNASISFAHYKGNDISDHLMNHQVISGTLDNQIDTCVALIKNSLTSGSTIKGTKTVPTQPAYQERVFREIIVNACIHRNYSISGSRIRVFLFDDRLEVHSPGRLPNTITIEKLSAGVSFAVNPIILKFMENLRYVDKLGRGLPLVWNEARKLGKQVSFSEIGEEFVVSLGI